MMMVLNLNHNLNKVKVVEEIVEQGVYILLPVKYQMRVMKHVILLIDRNVKPNMQKHFSDKKKPKRKRNLKS